MKKIATLTFCFLCLSCMFVFTSCAREEALEKQAPQELQAKDISIYKTELVDGKETTYVSMDFSKVDKPSSPDEFTKVFYFPPIQQYKTLTCWCFGVTSLLESEMRRLGKPEVKLSEMHTVYWEYVEKARRFIREKGNSNFSGGSEPNAVIARIKQYGAVRESDYTGLLPGKTEHDHNQLYEEMYNYLQSCKNKNYWDEEKILDHLKLILNKYMGQPQTKITVDGQTMTPMEYANNILRLPLDDYVAVMSFKYQPFYTQGEFKVPDNWWHSKDYYNVPLDDFYQAILNASKKGFSVAMSVDFSEPGNSGEYNLGIIPSFDISRELIDQDSREFRFANSTTTDDHVIHLVGYKETPKTTWFLMKDSWFTAYVGNLKGYFFYRDDYLRLKTLAFLVYKDAIPDLLLKFPGQQK